MLQKLFIHHAQKHYSESGAFSGGRGCFVPDFERLLTLEDVLPRVLLDEGAGLSVDDGKSRKLGHIEFGLERLLCQLSLERNGAPRHLGDVALEVVDLAVVRHEYDVDEVFLIAGFDGIPELLLEIGRVETGRRRPVRTVVEADVPEALALSSRVPVCYLKLGVVRVHHLVAEK